MNKYGRWTQSELLPKLIAALRNDHIIVGTSDTVIGLLAPLTEEGKRKLDMIKVRHDKPYLVLVENLQKAAQFSPAIQDPRWQSLLKACWPGPLTVVVPAFNHIPEFVKSSEGAIAIRVPNHAGLQNILPYFSGLFSTSANVSGMPVVHDVAHIDPQICNKVAYIIDDEVHKEDHKQPSTIIDLRGEKAKIIREGAYSRDMLHQWITL